MNYITIWEYDSPLNLELMTSYLPGIWCYKISPGIVKVIDDFSITGTYEYNNAIIYNIKSITVDGVSYLGVSDLTDLETQDEAFYYDSDSTFIYVTFTDFKSTFSFQNIFVGSAVGFANKDDGNGNVFSGNYYKPIISSISGIKKSKDPLFYGLLKFNTGTVKLINTDGEFDGWRTQRAYRQPTRLLLGEVGDAYISFIPVGAGVIGEHTRSWNDFSIKFEDPRNILSKKLPKNKLTKSAYPNLDDSYVDAGKPIAYGAINNAPCICLDELSGGATYTFLMCDTEYNAVSSITEVKVDGVVKSTASTNLSAGTFTLSSANVGGKFGDVTCSFVANTFTNGVEIIKDIMANYADTSYIDEYYDLVETALAVTACSGRADSLYIKEETEIKKAIEKICIDIDGLFFQHDDGLWTVRIYDPNRTPAIELEFDEILEGSPSIDGNEDQFLSSVIIKYNKNIASGEYFTYENKLYEAEVFAYYKALQSKTLETGLTNLASAQLKSESIMEFSKNIEDIVKIKVGFQFYDLEIMDFIICDPVRRTSGIDVKAVWEIIDISKDFNNYEIQLTLKYIKEYVPVVTTYGIRVTSTGDYRTTSDGDTRMVQE